MDHEGNARVNKSDLRKQLLERRFQLTAADSAAASARIADRFFLSSDLDEVRRVHVFIRIAKFREPDTSMIYYRFWRSYPEIATFAPRVDHASGEMESVKFGPDSTFIEGRWGIREPVGDVVCRPDELDLVIVPLLGFDRTGHRIGYGKGFYDRLLAAVRPDCRRVGLSYWPPTDAFETNAGDQPLDAVITPVDTFRRDPETSEMRSASEGADLITIETEQ